MGRSSLRAAGGGRRAEAGVDPDCLIIFMFEAV
jgi:hypothetical protein